MKNYLERKDLENNTILDNKIYGFFSRNGGFSKDNFKSLNCALNLGDDKQVVEKNRNLISKYCNIKKENMVFVNQTHSSKVIEINRENISLVHSADGMITKSEGIVLCILTADCAPIIIIGKKYVGIVHAGWKGLINGIIESAVEAMLKRGEKTENLILAIGPHLKINSFEVQRDFKKNLIKSKKLQYLSERSGTLFFNFTKCISDTLDNMLIKRYHISDYNTYSNPSLFFSYRYSKKKGEKNCGRQISIVGIKRT
tara:strand:- start:144 stop:911 length:768 start_codon:yes stop_codon:yes gene_type:complete